MAHPLQFLNDNHMYLYNSKRFKTDTFDQQGKYTYQELDDLINIDGYVPISTANELHGLRIITNQKMGVGTDWEAIYTTGVDKKYVVIYSLDLIAFTDWLGYSDFTGVFDGNKVNISNLTSISGFGGLFDTGIAATIRNVVLTDITSIHCGLINTDTSPSALIEACFVSGTINSTIPSSAGIAGKHYGVISRCISTVDITSTSSTIAGIAGENYGTIDKCFAFGNLQAQSFCGGITGWNKDSGTISNCYSFCNTTTTNTFSGSFCGANSATVTNSYSVGSASGAGNVGGFSGFNGGTITNSYWDTLASGNATSVGGTPKTTTEMQQGLIPDTAIYVGWSGTVWQANSVNEYPSLIGV